jgi:Lrp/AsnC family transcriptional regulator
MPGRSAVDEQDLKILDVLQVDGSLSIAAVAERTGISQNSCWRRIKRLEDEGVITGRVTLVDPAKIGLDLTVFVHVKASEHSEEWLNSFAQAVQAIPEVVEFYRMAGDVDYLLKMVVENIAAYDAVYKRLISSVKIVDVSSTFAMEEIKRTTALPLHHRDVAAR